MLLYSTFWIRRHDSCPAVPACPLCAYSCSGGFIHHQTSAWHRHALAIGISFRIPAPPHRLRRLPRVRQDLLCRLPLPRPNAAALEQLSGALRRKDVLSQATRGWRKLVVSILELARQIFVDYLVSKLVELHVPGVRRLVIECQAAKAEK